MDLVHNTTWGLVHNGHGTQWDLDMMGLVHNGHGT